MTTKSNFIREEWLNSAVDEWRTDFKRIGVKVPRLWIGVGPTGQGRTIGLCYPSNTSSDKRNQIWVSPTVNSTPEMLRIIAHEMVHAALDCSGGHGHKFQAIAKQIGLVAPFTQSVPSPAMIQRTSEISATIGRYKGPRFYASVEKANNGGTQTTRMLKLTAPCCGYSVRTTRKWIEIGLPSCPCGTKMEEG